MNNGPNGKKEDEQPLAFPEPHAAFERRLTESLRPVALPAGFAERVLAAARAQEAAGAVPVMELAGPQAADRPRGAKVLPFHVRPAVLRLVAGGALAASVLAGTFGVELERRHRDKAQEAVQQRMSANQQFAEASRITDEALAHTRKQLERAGVFEDEGQ